MKTVVTAAVALAALAIPSLASAAEQTYYDPAEGTFVTGTMKAVPTAGADTSRYTQEVTFWDSAEGSFVTTKVGATPVVATHDATQDSGTVKRFWDPAEGTFVEVKVAN